MIIDGIETKDCRGCGFCCKKTPCDCARRVYGPVKKCPALSWDGKRYWCELCRKPGEIGERYRAELYVGAGCCCGLNSDRQNIPPPEEEKVIANPVDRQCQVLLTAMAREWVSGDVMYFILKGAGKQLGEAWEKRAAEIICENRQRHVKDFMG